MYDLGKISIGVYSMTKTGSDMFDYYMEFADEKVAEEALRLFGQFSNTVNSTADAAKEDNKIEYKDVKKW